VKALPLEGATEHAVITRADSGRPVIAVTKSEVAARALWKALNERFPVVTQEHSAPRTSAPADGERQLHGWARCSRTSTPCKNSRVPPLRARIQSRVVEFDTRWIIVLTPIGSALIWWAPGNIIRAEGNTEVIARMRFFAEGFLLNTTGHA
jgi:hypothetical protein